MYEQHDVRILCHSATVVVHVWGNAGKSTVGSAVKALGVCIGISLKARDDDLRRLKSEIWKVIVSIKANNG